MKGFFAGLALNNKTDSVSSCFQCLLKPSLYIFLYIFMFKKCIICSRIIECLYYVTVPVGIPFNGTAVFFSIIKIYRSLAYT